MSHNVTGSSCTSPRLETPDDGGDSAVSDDNARERVLKQVGLTSTAFIGPAFPPPASISLKSDIEDTLSEFYKQLEEIDTSDGATENTGTLNPEPPKTSTSKQTQENIVRHAETDGDQRSNGQKQSSWSHWYHNEPYQPRRPRPADPAQDQWRYPPAPNGPPGPRFHRPDLNRPPFERNPNSHLNRPPFERNPNPHLNRPRFNSIPNPDLNRPPFHRIPNSDLNRPPFNRNPNPDLNRPPFNGITNPDLNRPPFNSIPNPDLNRPPFNRNPNVNLNRPPFNAIPNADLNRPPFNGNPTSDLNRPPFNGIPNPDLNRPPFNSIPNPDLNRPPFKRIPNPDLNRPPFNRNPNVNLNRPPFNAIPNADLNRPPFNGNPNPDLNRPPFNQIPNPGLNSGPPCWEATMRTPSPHCRPTFRPPPPSAFPNPQNSHVSQTWNGPGSTQQNQKESHFPPFPSSHPSQDFHRDSPYHLDQDDRVRNYEAHSENENAGWSRCREEKLRQFGEDNDRCQRYSAENRPPAHANANSPSLVLILMRGLPGSGKSTLARELLLSGPNGLILSTDDYFGHRDDYRYEAGLLGAAHEWNQNRAKDAMHEGRSPIIIDNTNAQAWEMKPYVAMALQRGYKVDFCEPDTSWKFDPYELEKRNQHGVPQEKISQMMERFVFPVSVDIVMTSQDPPHVTQRRRPEQQHDRRFH